MKEKIYARYPHTQDGNYIIDITAGKINDLYDDFDKYAPYVRKELDQDLVEYISDSAGELGKEGFSIRFHLNESPDEMMKARIIASINSYFLYLRTIELHEWARVMRTSLIFLAIGIAVMFLSVWVNEQMATNATVMKKVFAEGLTVAAWVSLWEALATFLINWMPYSRKTKMYERIASAPVLFM